LDLYERTNIIVAADHGFSTIAKDSEGGKRQLTAGFLAVDLALALGKDDAHMRLFDPDNDGKPVDPGRTRAEDMQSLAPTPSSRRSLLQPMVAPI